MGNEPSKPPLKKEPKKKKKPKKPKKDDENLLIKTYPYPDPKETSVYPILDQDYRSFKVCSMIIIQFLKNLSLFRLSK